jgi:sulfur-oxidizing protein SoxY
MSGLQTNRLPRRRALLRALGTLCVLAVLPLRAFAEQWNKAAFEARAFSDAMRGIGAASVRPTDQIEFKAPEIAENGAIVPIEVRSRLPGAQTIHVFAEKNPNPLAASFDFMEGAEPFFATRIKMRESGKLTVVVKAQGGFFSISRDVKVTIGGCGTT